MCYINLWALFYIKVCSILCAVRGLTAAVEFNNNNKTLQGHPKEIINSHTRRNLSSAIEKKNILIAQFIKKFTLYINVVVFKTQRGTVVMPIRMPGAASPSSPFLQTLVLHVHVKVYCHHTICCHLHYSHSSRLAHLFPVYHRRELVPIKNSLLDLWLR